MAGSRGLVAAEIKGPAGANFWEGVLGRHLGRAECSILRSTGPLIALSDSWTPGLPLRGQRTSKQCPGIKDDELELMMTGR